MLLLDLTHTSHTLAATGIQQVCRNLLTELSHVGEVDAIVYDPWQKSWRTAIHAEQIRLRPDGVDGAAIRKGEVWKPGRKIRGRLLRMARIQGPVPHKASCVLFPEFASERCLNNIPLLRSMLPQGIPFAAVFHDAIALRYPELSAKETVVRFPHYIATLASLDAVAAVSEASRQELLELWKKMGISNVPPVTTIPLGISPAQRSAAVPRAGSDLPQVLCVSTLEPRKNHLALLTAAESLWASGLAFRLELVGMAHRELGGPVVARIRGLERKGRTLSWLGSVDNDTLRARYSACNFTVYPSLMEGFGLPVLESLSYGKPCVCTTCGALDEVSQGGGCLRLAGTDPVAIADGLRLMVENVKFRNSLTGEASRRPLRSWTDYALDILTWTRSLTEKR